MEPLESKLGRLSPEQQREVLDFVDFLLMRSCERTAESSPAQSPPFLSAAPPVLPVQEPSADPGPDGVHEFILRPGSPRTPAEEDPATLLIREIALENEDILTTDYMDYGKFEPAPAPSPAAEAVQRVRKKLAGKKTPDPADDILDWIG